MRELGDRAHFVDSREGLLQLLDELLEGFAVHEIILDENGAPVDYRFLAANPAFEELTGLRMENVRGRTVLEVIPDIEPEWIERYGRVATTGEPATFTLPASALGGRIYEVRAYQPEPGLFATMFTDVTERENAISALQSAMRALKTLSFAGQILSRANDERQFLRDVCEMAVREGGYTMALAGFVVHDADQSIDPVAVFPDEEPLRRKITWKVEPEGMSVSGRAVRDRKTFIIRDAHVEPEYEHYRALAQEYGYRSAIGLPLIDPDNEVFAVLVVTSTEPDAFDAQEVRLLEQLAKELSFGVTHLRGEARRRLAEEEVRLSNLQLQKMVLDVTESMGQIVELRDPYTQGHQQRVAELSVQIARHMGLSEDEIAEVELAGIVHDIGKLSVPAEILTKPGRLSESEFGLIMEHPRAGYDILKNITFPWPIAEIVLQHHERIDGTGYPGGLKDTEIGLPACILAVADVVEAMASHRPYRASLGVDLAIEEIRSHPEKFDPDVSRACIELFEAGEINL
jgi:PAS domain S-box-containing protein